MHAFYQKASRFICPPIIISQSSHNPLRGSQAQMSSHQLCKVIAEFKIHAACMCIGDISPRQEYQTSGPVYMWHDHASQQMVGSIYSEAGKAGLALVLLVLLPFQAACNHHCTTAQMLRKQVYVQSRPNFRPWWVRNVALQRHNRPLQNLSGFVRA